MSSGPLCKCFIPTDASDDLFSVNIEYWIWSCIISKESWRNVPSLEMDLNSGNLWLVVECYTTSPGSSFGSRSPESDMEFVKKITPPDFQAKNFTPSISPNFNSFSKKNTKNEGKWKNLHLWQKFYTPPREGQISSQRWNLSVPSVPAAV